jgi:hypothetical protein
MTFHDEPGNRSGAQSGFLQRLKRSQAGNVLPMMAAAMVPMVGMIGSGLDMSRAYMAKAKLQNACDSAALATRRFMGGNAFDSAAEAEGEKFFNFNFPEGTMGTPAVALDIDVNETNTDVVEVSASTTVPTSMMRIFGKESMAVSVSCNADQDFVHNDIMLVLDVTGSMNCRVGTNCSYQSSKQTDSRLDALRDAAGALYRALEDADDEIVIRYGFMPYSMTVNVGKTTGFNRQWFRSPGSYHRCSNPTNESDTCNNWGSDISGPTRSTSYWTSSSFSGCIEERRSWSQRTASNITISQDVTVEDIDHVTTTNDNLKWQEYDTSTTRGEVGLYSNLARFCPQPARKLAEIGSESDFNDAVEDVTGSVGGYTNHDLGIMWGMRFLSSTGMFASENPEERGEMRVDKHLVFMTDGEMTADNNNYSAFGIPARRNRMNGSGSLVAKHQTRFLNACNRARQMGMTVWVIALDASSTDISACASGEDHYFEADDSDSLEDAFDTIGKEIGKLRLTR